MVLSSSITVARMVGLRAWTVHAFGCEKFRFLRSRTVKFVDAVSPFNQSLNQSIF